MVGKNHDDKELIARDPNLKDPLLFYIYIKDPLLLKGPKFQE